MILEAIENDSGKEKLDDAVHGVVAAVALGRALKEKLPADVDSYFKAVQKGSVRRLQIDLSSKKVTTKEQNTTVVDVYKPVFDVNADTNDNLNRTVDALDVASCQVLSICTIQTSLPQSLEGLAALSELSLDNCSKLKTLPQFKGLVALKILDLHACASLHGLPDLPTGLESLDLGGCVELKLLGKLQSLTALKTLNMDGCAKVTSLGDHPHELAALKSLEDLNLRNCKGLKELPQALTQLESLTALNLNQLCELEELPEPMSNLQKLKKLNLCYCLKLKTLPDLSENKLLEQVQNKLNRNQEGVVYVMGVDADLVHAWKACGCAPGCKDGLGEGYGTCALLCPWSVRKGRVKRAPSRAQ